jgi:hypothetical protein
LFVLILFQALSTPDRPDAVPFVPGTLRGQRWQPPPRPTAPSEEARVLLDLDLAEDECEVALESATADEIVDLAGVLGLHSIVNQVHYKNYIVKVFNNVRKNIFNPLNCLKKPIKFQDKILGVSNG